MSNVSLNIKVEPAESSVPSLPRPSATCGVTVDSAQAIPPAARGTGLSRVREGTERGSVKQDDIIMPTNKSLQSERRPDDSDDLQLQQLHAQSSAVVTVPAMPLPGQLAQSDPKTFFTTLHHQLLLSPQSLNHGSNDSENPPNEPRPSKSLQVRTPKALHYYLGSCTTYFYYSNYMYIEVINPNKP
jgi:hypothetical protein